MDKMAKKAETVDIHVVGTSGGQTENSYAAGLVKGGMGNTYHAPQHHVEKTFHNNVSRSSGVTTVNEVTGSTVNIGSGSHPPQQQVSQATSTSPGMEQMTVEDVQNLLKKERFPDSVRKTFEENGIDGKYFMNLLEDGVLDALGITSPLDKMKIKTILEKPPKY